MKESMQTNKPKMYKLEPFVSLMASNFCFRAQRCVLPVSFRWIYYYDNNKSTRKETGKTHLCAVRRYLPKWLCCLPLGCQTAPTVATFWFEYDLTNYIFFRYSHVVGRKESMQSNKPSWQAKLETATAIAACLWALTYGRTSYEMLN